MPLWLMTTPLHLSLCCCVLSFIAASQLYNSSVSAQPLASSERFVVARLARAPSQQTRAALAAAGLRELAQLPGRKWLLERTFSVPIAGAGFMGPGDVLELAAYARTDRISSELSGTAIAGQSARELPLLIHLMPGSDAGPVLQLLAAGGLKLLGRGVAGQTPRLSTLVPRAQAAELATELAAHDEVFFVERVHHLGFFNDRSAGTIQSGKQGVGTGLNPIWDHGLHGENQIVGLIDSGIDVDGCWFSDPSGKLPKINTWSQAGGYGSEVDASHRKILAYDFLYSCDQFQATNCEDPEDPMAWDTFGHGTHCSGSMVGDRASGGQNGMAPKARVVIQDGGVDTNACSDMPGLGCPVVDLYPLFQQAYSQGVRIHNNSYGDNEDARPPGQSNYTARSQDVDRFMWDHKDMLIVFAAGNDGTGSVDFSVGSPSTNKNGLSVGSVRVSATANSDDNITSFSSRGWTADGRIKPDLMAPGCNVSAGSDSDITSNACITNSGCGTSYAAPIVVGAAALVRQYLNEGFYPSGAKTDADAIPQPSAAVIKAILLNGSVPVTGQDNTGGPITPIPSNEQGWGRVQLDRVLSFAGGARKLYLDDHRNGFDAGATGAIQYTFKGVDPAEPFKVTLAWTDYPGTADSPPTAPTLGNKANLNPAQLVNDLNLVVTGAASYKGNLIENGSSLPNPGTPFDALNNVEQVILPKADSDSVTIEVRPGMVMHAGQDYALVVTGQWTSAGPTPAAPGPTAGAGGAAAAGSAAPIAGVGGSAGGGTGGASGATLKTDAAGSGAGAPAQSGAGGSQPIAAGRSGQPYPDANLGTRTSAVTSDQDGSRVSVSTHSDGGCNVVRLNAHANASGWLALLLYISLVLLSRIRERVSPSAEALMTVTSSYSKSRRDRSATVDNRYRSRR